MKPKIINIDQLRCNRLDETQEQFDMIKYENFNFPSSVSHHTHRHNYYMLFFCTHGTGKHLVDFEEHDIRAGQIIAMHPGQIHAWMEDKDLRGYLIFFTTAFFAAFLTTDFFAAVFLAALFLVVFFAADMVC